MKQDLTSQLADGLTNAIGAQTRLFFVQVTDIDRIEQGDISAYSQALGNIQVFSGENRWLTVGDRIYVTKISTDKYSKYHFVGWAANAANREPGSLLAFDSTNVASVAALPAADVARQNQIRLVNGVPYHYTDVTGWVPFGARPRQYVWYLAGPLILGAAGAVVQLDHPSTLVEVVLHAAVVPTTECLIDIQKSTNLASWASVFAVRPTIAAAASTGGAGAILAVPATVAAGTWLRVVTVTSGGAENVTVQLRLTS
jgi:hypothetical protein